MIQTLKLEKSFGLKRVLRGITLEIPAGQVVALVGPNGAGKSTLLRILATLSRPTAGRAAINGLAIPEDAMEARVSIGYIGHQTLLYDDLTVAENLRYYGKLYGVDDLEFRIEKVAARVGIEKQLGDRVRTLSRGLKQRTALARAIVHRPQVYLFDEPYTGLDQKSSGMLNELFAEARTNGAAVLFSTHEFARGIADADRALVMRGGRLVYDGMRLEWGDAASFNDLYAKVLETARSERHSPDAGARA